jgi:hypothetical protein
VFKISGKDADELAGEFDSTPPAPEIIGWRPILTPKNDVVDHLRKQGHTNPHVSAFVIDYLVPAMRVVEKHRKEYYRVNVSPRPGEPRHKILIADLDEALQQLNTFLFSVMADRSAEKPIPPLVFWMFASLYGFSDWLAWYLTPWNPLNGNLLPSIFRPKEELLLLCAPDFLMHKDRVAQRVFPNILSSALTFVTSLRQAMQVLAVDPILVDTGQHEPIYDKPRTYADVQNEIATRLANLPKFTARVKIIGIGDTPVEHTIKTLEPERGFRGIALQERIARIQGRDRTDGYTRPKQDIAEEIRVRQEQWSPQAQKLPQQQMQQQSPQPRRIPICPKCGAQKRQGAKFCNRCGEKV